MKPSLVVFLHSDRYDRLYQANAMVLTASSMGWSCHIFLFFHALASYMAGTWDDINVSSFAQSAVENPDYNADLANALQDGFESANNPSLYGMLEKARAENGGVKLYACSRSCKLLDLDLSAVREKVDEIVGLPTMMQISEDSRHVIYV